MSQAGAAAVIAITFAIAAATILGSARAQPTEPAPCAPTPAELAAWGLPGDDITESRVVASERHRDVLPADREFMSRALALASRARGAIDPAEALNFDETRRDVCLVSRARDVGFETLASLLALGAPAHHLLSLSQEVQVFVEVKTFQRHRVSVDEEVVTAFLLVASPNASWRDALNIVDENHTERVTSQAVSGASIEDFVGSAQSNGKPEAPEVRPGTRGRRQDGARLPAFLFTPRVLGLRSGRSGFPSWIPTGAVCGDEGSAEVIAQRYFRGSAMHPSTALAATVAGDAR